MVSLITVEHIQQLIQKIGIRTFFTDVVTALEHDFKNWNQFYKHPRHATHYKHGVIELMPISNDEFYAYKYVNGHPKNPENDKQTVTAIGMLAEVKSGYPLMISEMTLLTAIRTAATSALAAKYLAKNNARSMSIIGTGAQSEFQVLAMQATLGINRVHYFDIDVHAMQKFKNNLTRFDFQLVPGKNVQDTIHHTDIITTATADKKQSRILEASWIEPGMHINGIGGDCPGKTELDVEILKHAKIVVEYFAQTHEEGEIQNLSKKEIYAELWEIIAGLKLGRETSQEITVFDSVGFALEDYTVLRYVYEKSRELKIGASIDLIPNPSDPKDLFSALF